MAASTDIRSWGMISRIRFSLQTTSFFRPFISALATGAGTGMMRLTR